MLNYTIGAVKKKKSTAKKKTAAKKPVSKGRKPSAGSRVSKVTGERYFPSTAPKKKSYNVTTECSNAGTTLKKVGAPRGGAVLALCRASVKNLNTTAAALKKWGITKGKLSRKK